MSTVLCENIGNSKDLNDYVNEYKKQKDNNLSGINELKDGISFNFNKTLDGLKFLKYLTGKYKKSNKSKIKISLQISRSDSSTNLANSNKNPNPNMNSNINTNVTRSSVVKLDSIQKIPSLTNEPNKNLGLIKVDDSKVKKDAGIKKSINNSPLKLSRENTNANSNKKIDNQNLGVSFNNNPKLIDKNKNLNTIDSKKDASKIVVNGNNALNSKIKDVKDQTLSVKNNKKEGSGSDSNFLLKKPESIKLVKLNSGTVNSSTLNSNKINSNIANNVKSSLLGNVGSKNNEKFYQSLIKNKDTINVLNINIPGISNNAQKGTSKINQNIKITSKEDLINNNNNLSLKRNLSTTKFTESPVKNKNEKPPNNGNNKINNKNSNDSTVKQSKNDSLFLTKVASNTNLMTNNTKLNKSLNSNSKGNINSKAVITTNANKNSNTNSSVKNNNNIIFPNINSNKSSSIVRRESVMDSIKIDNNKFDLRHPTLKKSMLSPLKTLLNKSLNDSISTKAKTKSETISNQNNNKKNLKDNKKAKQFWNNIENIHKSYKNAQEKSRSRSAKSNNRSRSRPKSNYSKNDHRVIPLSSKNF